MSKIKKKGRSSAGLALARSLSPCLAAALVFFLTCLLAPSTIKMTGLVLVLALIAAAVLFRKNLRDRIAPPLIALAALVLMDGISTQYAISGKFALYEFLKVIGAFCIALILLAAAPGDRKSASRWLATVLSGASAIAALVSIDLLSTRILSSAALRLLGVFTTHYADVDGVEAGVRMTSLFANPNVFAGCMGIGLLLSLCLATSAENKTDRLASCVLLYINSLAFLLAFSIGATLSIAAAFLVYLLFERRESRPGTLMLMVAAPATSMAAAIVISRTSLRAWAGFDAVPLGCTILGAAALALLDRFVLQRLAGQRLLRGRAVSALVPGLLGLVAVYAVAAWNLTGDMTMEAGGTLRRAAYPKAGAYVLQIDADKPLRVMIESQNQVETMMHTSTVLYEGDANGAAFTVPDQSLVVYFNFTAPEPSHIRSAAYAGDAGSGKLPLAYRLLPGFISNRLQGLRANENAIQRFVFFSDGLALFRRSPVIGLGIGCLENALRSVQQFYYQTKHAHNHYIQTLAECGIVGLALFLGMLAVSGAALWRARRGRDGQTPLLSALAAALVFMALHASVEVVFSTYPYLPFAFSVIAMIGLCGENRTPRRLQTAVLLCVCATSAVFAVALVNNIQARSMVEREMSFDSLEQGAKMDRFEWGDYLLTYVYQSLQTDADDTVRAKAAAYADRLAAEKSNSVHLILAQYYFETGEREKAFAMLETHVDYTASDEDAWNSAFHMLEQYDDGSFGAEAAKLSDMMAAWNAAHIGTVSLDDASAAYLEGCQ